MKMPLAIACMLGCVGSARAIDLTNYWNLYIAMVPTEPSVHLCYLSHTQSYNTTIFNFKESYQECTSEVVSWEGTSYGYMSQYDFHQEGHSFYSIFPSPPFSEQEVNVFHEVQFVFNCLYQGFTGGYASVRWRSPDHTEWAGAQSNVYGSCNPQGGGGEDP